MKGGDLIASSFRLIGVLASGETPSGAMSADALLILQQMIDAWMVERMMTFTLNIDEFALVPGQQVYTYGLTGNFNKPRPARIERMSIVNLSNPAQPLELPIEMLTDEQWQREIPVKVITSTLPLYVYDDGAFPFRNLSFYPVPQILVNTRIYSWAPAITFSDLVTDVPLPPAYAKAMRYNLAVDFMAEFPGNPATFGQVTAIAAETKAKIKILNSPTVQSGIDQALVEPEGGYYDWRADMPVGGTR